MIDGFVAALLSKESNAMKLLTAFMPVMTAGGEQIEANVGDVPDDAWLSVPQGVRPALLMALAAVVLERASK